MLPSMNAFCNLHEGLRVEYVSVDPAQDFVFKCVNCISEENVPQSTLIPINLILSSDSKTIFANFPITDRSLLTELRTLAQAPTTSNQVILKISSFFKELRANFLHKLEIIEQKMTEKAQSISEFGSIIEQYNQICAKKELKAIINDNEKDLQVRSAEIKTICQEVLSKEQENNSSIRISLDKLKNFQSAIDFETPGLIKEQIFSTLQKIEMFLVEDFKQFQEFVERKRNDKNENISKIMKLVNNKLNGISVESSQLLKEQLNKISFAFSAVEVPEVGTVGTYLESLNENSSQAIQKLVEDLAKNQQADEVNDEREKQENLVAGDLVKLINNQTNLCSNEVAQVVNTLQMIPIPKQFTKTNYKSSEEIQISENNGSVQFSLNPARCGQVVSEILDNSLGYLLKLKFTKPISEAAYEGFYIGLIPDSQIHSKSVLSDSHESGLFTYPNYGAKIILKGGRLTSEELSETTDCIEFRFCISKQLFLFADPSYSNINQAEARHFDPSQQYRFGVFLNGYHSRSNNILVSVSEFGTIDPGEVINFK